MSNLNPLKVTVTNLQTNDVTSVNLATPWIKDGKEEMDMWKNTKQIHFRDLSENLRRIIFNYLFSYRNHGSQRRDDWNNLVVEAQDKYFKIRIEEA